MTTPPPIPTQSAMTDSSSGLVSRVWLKWFLFLNQTFGFNQSVQVNGVPFPGEAAINFLSPFTATDNRINGSTDISLSIGPSVQSTFNGVMGQNYQNMTGGDKFVTVIAQTNQAVGNNSAFALYVGPTSAGQVTCSVGNVTNGPGYATVSCLVPAGSWYSVNSIYGTLAIIAEGWQEFDRG
jgi:hypothetical protein